MGPLHVKLAALNYLPLLRDVVEEVAIDDDEPVLDQVVAHAAQSVARLALEKCDK